MARFADKLYFDKQKIDGMESAVLLTLIVGGLALRTRRSNLRYRTSIFCLVKYAAPHVSNLR